MNLFLTLTLFLYCVLTPFNMAGLDQGRELIVVEGHLQDDLVWMCIPNGINIQLAINILGKYRKYCRTVYWYEPTIAFLELIPDSELRETLVRDVLGLSGYQSVGNQMFFSDIKHNREEIAPQIIKDYAKILISGQSRHNLLRPGYLHYNSQYIDNPFRVRTPPPLHRSTISDIPPESTPLDNVTARPKKKVVVTPKSRPGFLTILGENPTRTQPTFFPHTVPRPSRIGNFIPNICTPQNTSTGKPKPQGTPQVPKPLHRPSKGQTGNQPITQNHTGVGGPPFPQDGTANPPILQPQHIPGTDNYAGESFDPFKIFKDPPVVPRTFHNPLYVTPDLTSRPLSRSVQNIPDHLEEPLDRLKFFLPHLATPELNSLIRSMIRESKRRPVNPSSNNPFLSHNQGQENPQGRLVGVEGGLGNPEPEHVEKGPKPGKPVPHFDSTHVPTVNPFHSDLARANLSTIAQPQVPDYAVLQTSMQAMTEGLLKSILKEGILRKDTPKLPVFTGKPNDDKITWRRWELEVKGLEDSYEGRAIKEAMNKALQGDAAIVADSLEDNCSWKDLLKALKAKFAVVTSKDVMMKTFYQITQGTDSVSQFAIKLEKVLSNIRTCHPHSFMGNQFSNDLKERLFHGMADYLKNTLRYRYNLGCSYEELLLEARQVEGEQVGITERIDTVTDSSTSKTKAKASVAQQVKDQPDIQKLANAYRCAQGELTKMQQKMGELTQFKQALQVSSISTHAPTNPGADSNGNNQHQARAPQNQNQNQNSSQNKGYNNPNYQQHSGRGRGRGYGVRGGFRRQVRDPPGKPEGWSRLCYWCRDYVPFEEANHMLRDCPFYQSTKDSFWTSQNGYTPTPVPKSNGQSAQAEQPQPKKGN